MKTGLPPTDWDTKVNKLGGSVLQSRPWAQFQQDLGREVVWDEGEGWLWQAAVRHSHGLHYLLSGYGPVAKNPQSLKLAIDSLVGAGAELGADFVRLEPQIEGAEKVLRLR